MSITANTTTILPISSYKGIDGSNAIPNIPEGYCVDAENVDLSEAGVIKKRAGYCQAYRDLPVPLDITAITLPPGIAGTRFRPTAAITVRIDVKLLNAAGLAYLDQELGYQSDRTTNTNLCIVTILPNNTYVGPFNDFESFGTTQPIKILSSNICIAEYREIGVTGIVNYSIRLTPHLPYFKRVTNITVSPAEVITVFTDEPALVNQKVFIPLIGNGTITSVTDGVSFNITIDVAGGVPGYTFYLPSSLSKTYYKIYFWGYYTGYESYYNPIINGASAIPAAMLTEIAILGVLGYRSINGLGVSPIPNTVDSYYSATYGKEIIFTILHGTIYYPAVTAAFAAHTLTAPAALTSQTPTYSQGTYAINVVSGAAYQVNDTVYIKRYDSSTQVTTQYNMTVQSIVVNTLYVTGNVPSSISTGEVLHWNRYTNKITFAAPTTINIGYVIYIDGVTPHRVWYSNFTTLCFEYPVSVSSSSTIYAVVDSFEWYPMYASQGYIHYPIAKIDPDYLNSGYLLPSTKFNNGCYFSSDSGIVRYDGTGYIKSFIPAPKVIGVRSISGSKGTFPVETSTNNKKIGKTVKAVFTYVMYDVNGIRTESAYSDPGEGIFVPNAALDGSNYAELVEFKVTNNLMLITSAYEAYLHVYVSTVNTEVNAEQDYFLYRIIKMSTLLKNLQPNPIYPTGVYWNEYHADIISVIVGDISPSALSAAPQLSAIDDPIDNPPQVKYLVSSSNRLIGANLTSFPYTKLYFNKVFDSAGRFAAQCAWIGYYNYYGASPTIRYVLAPLGLIANGAGGYQLITGSTEANATTTTSGDNSWTSDAYRVKPIDWTNAAWAVHTFTVAYTDNSNSFNSADYGISASPTQGVLRKAQREVSLAGLPIDFENEVFTITDLGATLKYVSANKWTDTTLDASTTAPYILKNVNFAVFEQITVAIGGVNVPLTGKGKDIFVWAAAGESAVYLEMREGKFLTASWGWVAGTDPIRGEYVVIHGLKNFLSITSTASNEVLSWDADLVWLPTYYQAITDGTDTFYQFKLTPYLAKATTTGTIIVEAIQIGYLGSGNSSDTDYNIQIFKALNAGTTLSSQVTLTGFSTPQDYITVTKAASGIGNLFLVGHYATFELVAADSLKVPINYPKLTNVAWKVIEKLTDDSIKLKAIASPAINTGGISESLTVTANSYIVDTTLLFPYGSGTVNLYTTTTPNYYNQQTFGYLLVRGEEYSSCCFQLSGPAYMYFSTQNVATIYAKSYSDYMGTKGSLKIDYSAITGVKYSCVLLTNLAIPIPVPRRISSDCTFLDLAAPLYSPTPYVGEDVYVQILKRIDHVVHQSTLFGTRAVVSQDNIRSGEIVFYATEKNTVFRIVVTGTVGYQEISGLDGAAGNPTTIAVTGGSDTVYGRQDNIGSGIVWTNASIETNTLQGSLPAFREKNYIECNTEDGGEITGLTPFQNNVLIFKRNSIWRLSFDDTGRGNIQRIQSNVGSTSPYNLPSTLDFCYFINSQGVFYVNGNTVENVFKVSRQFSEKTYKNEFLLQRCAGYVDHERKVMYLGAPYFSTWSNTVTNVDGQFVFCYNDGVMGWSCNTRIPALKYVTSNNNIYFISQTGGVCKIRTEPVLSRFRDGNDPIYMNLKTRYIDSKPASPLTGNIYNADKFTFKFWRNAMFGFADTSTYNFTVNYSVNYESAEYALNTYPRTKGTPYKGLRLYGTDHFMKLLRETFAERVNSLSFHLSESSVDTDAPIYHIQVEGWFSNTRLVAQKSTTPGERT